MRAEQKATSLTGDPSLRQRQRRMGIEAGSALECRARRDQKSCVNERGHIDVNNGKGWLARRA